MNKALPHQVYETQFCVVGGGLAGLAAAISAARHGAKVVLIQDRPVLGGNSSSEIRMWVRGAHGLENKETGILSELELENMYRNPSLNANLWDSVLYQKAQEEENLTLLLNTSCVDAAMEDGRIASVLCWQLTTYSWITVKAELFADCSGDSILAPLTGALYRHGREAADEFSESMEPDVADSHTMGMSCLLQARETDHPVPFIAPPFANCYPTDDDFAHIAYDGEHSSFREHTPATDGCNFWWIEVGGLDHSIHDTETLRDELLRITFGIWDHIKNHGDHGAENWELEWIGFLPGKRESRRYVGDHVMTQNEVQSGGRFPDVVAFGGWPLDDHNPAGFRSTSPTARTKSQMYHVRPYGIPYRCLYSKNIPNLMFAGRNISVTHAALSSTRVMATCTVLGQAAGVAAAIAVARHITPRQVGQQYRELLQQQLLEDYCKLPGLTREIPALNDQVKWSLTEDEKRALLDGIERPTPEEADKELRLYGTSPAHYITRQNGQKLELRFDTPTLVHQLRMVFDLDFTRESISSSVKARIFAMKFHEGKDFRPVNMPRHLCRAFSVTAVLADGQTQQLYSTDCNHRDLFKLPIDMELTALTIAFGEAWGSKESRIWACDVQ